MSSTSVDLPLPETPVTHVRQPSGNAAVTILQIVLARATQSQPAIGADRARARGHPPLRHFDARSSGKIICGRRVFRAQDFFERALRDELATARTGARPEIENVIRRANRFLVVLDHDDGIPEIAQPAERRQQPCVVALMQADARLIEHIKNAGQTRADLRREPDALRFAAGKRAAFAVQGQIVEPDFDEKLQPRLNLAQDVGDDFALLLCQVHPRDELRRGFDRQLRELMDVLLDVAGSNGDRQNFRLQARAVADLTWYAGHESADALARELALGLLVEPLHLWDRALQTDVPLSPISRSRRISSRSPCRPCRESAPP